jgi:hypothetical protein
VRDDSTGYWRELDILSWKFNLQLF